MATSTPSAPTARPAPAAARRLNSAARSPPTRCAATARARWCATARCSRAWARWPSCLTTTALCSCRPAATGRAKAFTLVGRLQYKSPSLEPGPNGRRCWTTAAWHRWPKTTARMCSACRQKCSASRAPGRQIPRGGHHGGRRQAVQHRQQRPGRAGGRTRRAAAPAAAGPAVCICGAAQRRGRGTQHRLQRAAALGRRAVGRCCWRSSSSAACATRWSSRSAAASSPAPTAARRWK
jgi:hypothetical protein